MMGRSADRAHRTLATLAALVGGLLFGCVLELPAVCGDGRVDAPDEDCDPAVDGTDLARCIDCKQSAPATCGDGKLDLGERCDTNDFGNKDCPSGKGFLSCTADCRLDESTCDPCGNGRIDLDVGEECDPKAPGSLLQPKNCSELTTYPLKPYTSGRMTQCIADKCLWYRGPCGYCGDEEVDPPLLVDLNYPDQLAIREVCDGQDAQPTDLRDYCRSRCPGDDPSCSFECTDGCKQFSTPEEGLQCCAQSGSPCPHPGDPLPCCAAYDAGLDDLFAAEACGDRFQRGGLKTSVCK